MPLIKLKINFLLFAFFLVSNLQASYHDIRQRYPFKKVIIWGHKLHSHSHSYIHAAFFKAFKHLGYDTYWFDDKDNVSRFDFSDSLFITEWQVDNKMPLRTDCHYILHNPDESPYRRKYDALFANGNAIRIQVYRKDLIGGAQHIEDLYYWNEKTRTFFMPWATDLLPTEIDQVKQKIQTINKEPIAWYIGYVNNGSQGNEDTIMPFARACTENGITFNYFHGYMLHPVSMEENMHLIQTSIMAPAIQGKGQCDVEYVPCRIFKNISYGQLGITNSKAVYDLFKGKIVYNPDTYQLFYDAKKRMETWTLAEQFELMDFIKEKHTYLNRIEWLLNYLGKVKKIQ